MPPEATSSTMRQLPMRSSMVARKGNGVAGTGPARARRFVAPETAWMTGSWEGGGQWTENCSFSVDSSACSSYKHTPSTERRRECCKEGGQAVQGATELLQSPEDTETWEGDGRVAEKSSNSVDRPPGTPYKHTPS